MAHGTQPPRGRPGRSRPGEEPAAGADRDLVGALEQVAARVGLEIRRESLDIGDSRLPGGFCEFEGRRVCIVSDALEPHEEARVIGLALLRFDLESVFVAPVVRDFLESLQ